VLVSPDGFAGPGVEYGKPQKVPALMKLLPYTMPRSMLRANLAIAYADQTRLTDATVQRTYDMMLASGVRSAIVARIEQVVLPDPVPLLRRLNMPTLLLWADKDGMIPVSNAQDYLAALPNATLVVLPGIGHVPQEEAPQETIIPLRDFLAR
jgi:pimeloyl-ACP methyl ester carboxylesterase